MSRKIIFLDVDGTLVDYDNRIPESAIQAIRQARENGHLVYVCTGRSKAEMPQEIWDIGLDGMIGGNGSYVEHEGQVIMHQLIPLEVEKRVVDWLHERGLEFYLESNNGLFASEHFRDAARPVMKLYAKKKGKTDAEVAYKQNEKIYCAFPELAYLGMEISPGTSEFLKKLDSSITVPKMTALKYDGIDFQFNSKSGNMYLYDEILEEIQRKGQALQGMYPMDVQYLFQKDIFIPELQFRYYTPEDKKDQLYDAYLEDLESQMKEFFNNQPLPSGLYAVKIDRYEGDKLVNNSGGYHVRIGNRQVVKFIKDLQQESLD